MNSSDREALIDRVSGMSLAALHEEIALETVAAKAAMERRDSMAQLAVFMADRGIESAAELATHDVALHLDHGWRRGGFDG